MNLRRPDSWNFSYLAVFDKTQWSLLSKIVRLIFTKMLDLLCASGINCKSNKVIVRFRLLNFWEIEIKCISFWIIFDEICWILFWIIFDKICQCGSVLLWSNRSLSSTIVALYNSRGPSLIFWWSPASVTAKKWSLSSVFSFFKRIVDSFLK